MIGILKRGWLMKGETNRKRLYFISFGLISSLILLGLLMYEITKKDVTLELDGKKQEIRTHARTVEELFQELGIDYGTHDVFKPAKETEIQDGMAVVWKPAVKVSLIVDNVEQERWTTEKTVADFLKAEGIELAEKDRLHVDPGAKIEENMEIRLDKAFAVTVNDGGEEKKYWTPVTTVSEFLQQTGIPLNEWDRVEPGLNATIHKGDSIEIVRVEKLFDVTEEKVDYAVVKRKDSSLLSGKEKIVQAGKVGKRRKKYEVVLENGKEVSRTLIEEKMIEEPVDQVVAVGTRVIQPVSRGAEKGKEYVVTATAYTGSENGSNGITATGFNLRANPSAKIIAVDPKVIPLGTKVYVEGYGYAVAADTGSGVKGYKIDVFIPNIYEAKKWGRKQVKIRILE
jgi:Domain of unknown function (DUF348)./G5 domain./3D domain.